MENIFYEIYDDLPRQGPGNKRSTLQAARLIANISKNPQIVDMGCGTGQQTLELANYFGGEITAIDIHQPYLNTLTQNAKKLGYEDVILTLKGDISDLALGEKRFDLIWAEGSVYIIGFQKGLSSWKRYMNRNAYMAVSELTWIKEDPPEELKDFWDLEYPGMQSIESNVQTIKSLGLDLVDYFILPPTAWWDQYYTPLEQRLEILRKKYSENEDELELIEFVQLEIDIYKSYPDYYGYVFYVMQNK
ncbi:MAG: class I SAM-dependent methyltransferase [Bacteroidales bacterium]|nr:class I SAM-dependent methyltransferase [Bacteroidales bacterium]MCF8405669.1 class I SAM-dependent methyltransferase [Bacteroidales bacterium]